MSLQARTGVVLAGSAALMFAVSLPQVSAAGTTNGCFWSRDVRDSKAPDTSTVYVRVARNEIYELKLAAPCADLAGSAGVSLHTRGSSRVCEGPGANVSVRPTRTPVSHAMCQVSSVRKLNYAETKALPAGAKP
jgi:hypothetical protein